MYISLGLPLTFKHRDPRRIALKLSYDGTGYHGWQKQPKLEKTIQGTLERELSAFLKESITVDGASRTDAGVHAEDQLAAFTTTHPVRLAGLIKAMNKKLPEQIAVNQAYEVDLGFVPRFVNEGKRYRYRIYYANSRHPMLDRFATWIHYPLNTEAMMHGLAHLHGEHDFQSFAASNGQHQTSIRALWLTSLTCKKLNSDVIMYEIHFAGSGFLKQMVRNLVGTLLEIGRGHWEADCIPEIISAKARSAAGPTAPARGLCLEEMFWTPPK